MATPRLIVADEPAVVGADWICARLGEVIMVRGEASIALSGGSSPRALYAELARRPVAWAHVDVFFVDERGVAPDDVDSNFAMAREQLLRHVSSRNVWRMPGESADLAAAARDYAARLPAALDVVVLGVGDDGHTASLFPGRDWSRPTGAQVLVTHSPKPPHPRLTLSPEIIGAARQRLVLATGAGKAEVVRIGLDEPADPARYPMHLLRDATWLLDRAAASRSSWRNHG